MRYATALLLLAGAAAAGANASDTPAPPAGDTSLSRLVGDGSVSDVMLFHTLSGIRTFHAGTAATLIADTLSLRHLAVDIVGANTLASDRLVVSIRFHSVAEVGPGGEFVRIVSTSAAAAQGFILQASATGSGTLAEAIRLDTSAGVTLCPDGTQNGLQCLPPTETCSISTEPAGIALLVAASSLLILLLWLAVLLASGKLVPSDGTSLPFGLACCCGAHPTPATALGSSGSSRAPLESPLPPSSSSGEKSAVSPPCPPAGAPGKPGETRSRTSSILKGKRVARSRSGTAVTATTAPDASVGGPIPSEPCRDPSAPRESLQAPPDGGDAISDASHTEVAQLSAPAQGLPQGPPPQGTEKSVAAVPSSASGGPPRGRRTPPVVVAPAKLMRSGSSRDGQLQLQLQQQQQQHQQTPPQHPHPDAPQQMQQLQPQRHGMEEVEGPVQLPSFLPRAAAQRRDVSYIPERGLSHGLMMDSPEEESGEGGGALYFSDDGGGSEMLGGEVGPEGEAHRAHYRGDRFRQGQGQPYQPEPQQQRVQGGGRREQLQQQRRGGKPHQQQHRHPLAEQPVNEAPEWGVRERRGGGGGGGGGGVPPPYFDEHERRAGQHYAPPSERDDYYSEAETPSPGEGRGGYAGEGHSHRHIRTEEYSEGSPPTPGRHPPHVYYQRGGGVGGRGDPPNSYLRRYDM